MGKRLAGEHMQRCSEMCSNYRPVTRTDRLLTFFGVERPKDEPIHDIFPLGEAPFIRLSDKGGGTPALIAEDGFFGLIPQHAAAEVNYGRRTYNARSETVHRLPSFRRAWALGKRCIVPAECIFEPNWETGRAVRWRIGQHGDVPIGIAGIYEDWRMADGTTKFTFAMLTVNADSHPIMKRFHRPGEEKRMVVILDREDYLPWLTCSVQEASSYFKMWDGVLEAYPDPLPPRPSKSAGPPPSAGDELF